MEANKTIIAPLLDGSKQFRLPLFQRNYIWTKKEWEALWKDIENVLESEKNKNHFLGAIVTYQLSTGPDSASKYIVIDGQQRLTTIIIALAAIRDIAKKRGDDRTAEEIHGKYLTNYHSRHKEEEFYKLWSSQKDREVIVRIIEGDEGDGDNLIRQAYNFYREKIEKSERDYLEFKRVITHSLLLVTILLDTDDNHFLVFESLNAKGKSLTQADLIKNYIFMKITEEEQEKRYKESWQPMEQSLGEKLTEFIRHFLMKEGEIIKNSEVYDRFKESLGKLDAQQYLMNLAYHGNNYQKILNPEYESDSRLKKQLNRINRIEVTTAYPLLLKLYEFAELHRINKDQFVNVLEILENYLIRRYIAGIATNQLNKIFPSLIAAIKDKDGEDVAIVTAEFLSTKGYPKNSDLERDIVERKLYGGGDRQLKTKFILESLEESFNHKEKIELENLTIEHIMPRTLNDWWIEYLGDEGIQWHEDNVDVLGNLTLTGYNSELSNMSFERKKEFYAQSHLEINRYFDSIPSWRPEDVRERSLKLAALIIERWKYFGKEYTPLKEVVTGLWPIELIIRDSTFPVNSWRDVLNETLNYLYDFDPIKFDEFAQNNPTFLSKDTGRFRSHRIIRDSYFAEMNMAAQTAYNFCRRAVSFFGLNTDDWVVKTINPQLS